MGISTCRHPETIPLSKNQGQKNDGPKNYFQDRRHVGNPRLERRTSSNFYFLNCYNPDIYLGNALIHM